jgi:hypothetical protein
MEIQEVVEVVVEEKQEIVELSDLDLAWIGGGVGTAVLA